MLEGMEAIEDGLPSYQQLVTPGAETAGPDSRSEQQHLRPTSGPESR